MKITLERTKYIQPNFVDEVDREYIAQNNPYKPHVSETSETTIDCYIRTSFRLSLYVKVQHSNLRTRESVRNEAIEQINCLLYGEFKYDLISLRRLIHEDTVKAVNLLEEMIRQLP